MQPLRTTPHLWAFPVAGPTGMLTPEQIIAASRLLTLLCCLSGAAYLDLKTRRVPNDWWITWAKPALFILCLELWVTQADWTIWLSVSAMVAYASTTVIGRPTLSDLSSGSLVDWMVTIWYVVGGIGLAAGAYTHGTVLLDLLDVGSGVAPLYDFEKTEAAWAWGRVLLLGLVLLFFELAYHMRLLHGGADVKGMMFVALCLPWWSAVHFTPAGITPPALSLLIWGAVAFLVLPVWVFIGNLRAGDAGNLRMAWHARRMELEQIPRRHVWLLDEVMETPDGERSVVSRTRPQRGGRAENEVDRVLEELAEAGADKAWVTEKYPFLVFLLLGTLPLFLLGDPVGLLLTALGLA